MRDVTCADVNAGLGTTSNRISADESRSNELCQEQAGSPISDPLIRVRDELKARLRADPNLTEKVDLYLADNIRSMVRYDPGLGMKLWPYVKHNTRRYVSSTLKDRKLVQYVEKKLHSRISMDVMFRDQILVYVRKSVWVDVRNSLAATGGFPRGTIRDCDVIRAETMDYVRDRLCAMLRHEGTLEKAIMEHVDRTRREVN